MTDLMTILRRFCKTMELMSFEKSIFPLNYKTITVKSNLQY